MITAAGVERPREGECPGANGRALYDIRDVEMFVRNTLDKAPLHFDTAEFEELVAEGMGILYDLAHSYEPHRAGYEQGGSFAGYAAFYLPKRLTDAWHRLHPNHVYVSLPDGTRRWEYLPAADSFDARQVGRDGFQRDVVCFDRTSHPATPENVVPSPSRSGFVARMRREFLIDFEPELQLALDLAVWQTLGQSAEDASAALEERGIEPPAIREAIQRVERVTRRMAKQ